MAAEATTESGMRVESFEIAVPRESRPTQEPAVASRTYADRYVPADRAIEDLIADENELVDLLEDPRTGTYGRTWRRAANG